MKAPSMRSEVAALAIPRTRGPTSAKNLLRSLVSENFMRSNAGLSPLKMTGRGGPISNTAVFSPAIIHSPRLTRSHEHRHGLLHKPFECRQQLGPERAVDHAVIAGKRHRHHAGESNSAALRLHRLPARGADREDRRLWRIDDRGKLAHIVHAEIRDRRRAALVFVGLELLCARAGRQVLHFVSDG